MLAETKQQSTAGDLEMGQAVWRRRRPPISLLVGATAVLALVLLALAGPVVAPYDPNTGDIMANLAPPSASHLLGTDLYGRDMLTRIIYGARVALSVSVAVVVVALVVGALCGLAAGYYGGVVETLLMRVVDVVIAFPSIVLVIAVLAVISPGLFTIFVAIAVVDWTTYARLFHGQVLSVRERDYVEACRAVGMSSPRILMRHVLPNVASAALVYATLDVTQVILAVSGLSFLGLGVQPPTPEWGYMINEGRSLIYTSWWISTFPGIAVILTTLAFSVLGDGLAAWLEVPR
jgi:peptide/nickel transport system permease protein